MSIRAGGGVGGRYSRPIIGITSYENRLLQQNEHKYFWEDSKFCIDNGIYLIVNIDTYLTNSRWKPTNQVLRDFVIDTKTKLKAIDATKLNCRFTYDNESDEHMDFQFYMNGVRVVHDALNGDFDLGAGNFRTGKKDWYEALAKLAYKKDYEVFDFHMQDGLNNTDDIRLFCNWIAYLKNTYTLRISCTEGNNFYNVSTLIGHSLLKAQMIYAESIGCEDFCFPYINWMYNGVESDSNMSYNWNFNPVSDYWGDILKFIQSKKPIIEMEDKDMQLEEYYYKLKTTFNRDPKRAGIKFIQTCLKAYPDGIWEDITDEAVRKYQGDHDLDQDKIVGPLTFRNMMKNFPNAEIDLRYFVATGKW